MTRAVAVAQTLFGVLIVAVAAALLVDAATLPPPTFDILGSAAVPRALCVLVIVMSVPLIVQGAWHLRRGPGDARPIGDAADRRPPRRPGLAVAAFALVCAFVVVLQGGWLDYAAATTLFLVVLTALLGGGRPRQLAAGAALALLLGVGGDYLFTTVFLIDLP